MKDFLTACQELYRLFMDELQQEKNSRSDSHDHIYPLIVLCEDYIRQLRDLVVEHNFPDTEQQIHFFKQVKPAFVSQAIFYSNLFNLQVKWPVGDTETQQNYLHEALAKITRFYLDHQSFYEYYRSGLTHLDAQYFVRGRPDWRLYADCQFLFADPVFCTPCDQKLATLVAYERLQEYIQEKQRCLLQGIPLSTGKPTAFTWTGSRAALGELVYAIHTSACINNGKVTVQEIARFFEVQFNITLVNDIYKIYREMRMRKNNPVKFLDYLRDQLSKRMDMDDD